jgi:hypothetical protein
MVLLVRSGCGGSAVRHSINGCVLRVGTDHRTHLAAAFFMEGEAAIDVASTIVPPRSNVPRASRRSATASNIAFVNPCASSRCRKFKIVVSSGIASRPSSTWHCSTRSNAPRSKALPVEPYLSRNRSNAKSASTIMSKSSGIILLGAACAAAPDRTPAGSQVPRRPSVELGDEIADGGIDLGKREEPPGAQPGDDPAGRHLHRHFDLGPRGAPERRRCHNEPPSPHRCG